MLWRRMSLLAFCMGVSSLIGQTPESSSGVNSLIQRAFEENPQILAAQQRVAEARGLLRQAGVRPAATLEVNAASGRPLGTKGEEEYTVGYFRPVETAGKRPKRIQVAEKAVELAESELAERKRQLAYDIKLRYLDVVSSQRKVEAIDRIVAIDRESYRLVDARVQLDDAAPLERQLLLVELNRTEALRAATAGQAESAQFELRRAIAARSNPLIVVSFETPAGAAISSLDELQRRAMEARPDLRTARILSSQAVAELELVDAMGRADLTVSAQYVRRNAQFEDPLRTTVSGAPLLLKDRDNVLTLGISIPLQGRSRNQGNVEAALARQTAANLKREHLQLTIPSEVGAAWHRYQATRNTLAILNRGVLDESAKNLGVIRQAYNLGQLRLLDVLNEQRRLLETQLSYIDTEAELARSVAELERAVGGELR